MFYIPLLIVAWLAMAYFSYRLILRDEINAAKNKELNSEKSLESDQTSSQTNWHPYIRMF